MLVEGGLQRLATEISSALADGSPALVDLAKGARNLSLQLVAMTLGDVSPNGGVRELSAAVEAFARSRKPEPLAGSARALLEAVAAFGRAPGPVEAEATPDTAPDADAGKLKQRRLSWIDSPFTHGLTSFEICAGGGGQACGLSRAGFRHVGLLEIEPEACETLRAAFGPEHVIQADLVGYDPGDIGPVDLFAGGVPCQSFSKASSRRKGAADRRDRFPDALRLIERLKPRAIMLENVVGIFDPDYDMYRFRILRKLASSGYHCEWRKVDCSHFGIAQSRVRTILVGFRDPAALARFA